MRRPQPVVDVDTERVLGSRKELQETRGHEESRGTSANDSKLDLRGHETNEDVEDYGSDSTPDDSRRHDASPDRQHPPSIPQIQVLRRAPAPAAAAPAAAAAAEAPPEALGAAVAAQHEHRAAVL
ncbi:hypothetical protein EW145_g8614, partial [Phellinidium pouzarii]